MRIHSLPLFVSLVLAVVSAHGEITLYSSTFGGSNATDLNGQPVDTSGASAAQHLLYGTTVGTTWAAGAPIKADGSVPYVSGNVRPSATLNFTPQDGYVYTLTMTSDYAVTVPTSNDWLAVGFFMQPNYAGLTAAANGATVWALTRPGSANATQVAHYSLNGGAGNVNDPSPTLDSTAPSTISVVLDTTAGTGDWSAAYYQGAELLTTVADLGAVDIESVGIGVNFGNANHTGDFQSFELKVASVPELVHHWKLDETAGQTADDTAGTSPGTLGTTAGAELEDPALNQQGVFGTAFAFTGTELDRIGIPNLAPFQGLAIGTVSGWFKTGSATRGAILSYGEGLGTESDRLVVEMSPNGSLRLVIREGNVNLVDLETTATYLDDTWHHFAFMQDGVEVKVYVDGAEVTSFGIQANSGAWFDDVTNVGLMTLGYEFRGPGSVEVPFTGSLDDLAVFSRVLTAQELDNVFNGGAENYDSVTTPPAITALDPDGASGVYPGTDLVATFNRDIALTGGGTVTLTDTVDGSGTVPISLPDPQVTVSGRDLIISPSAALESGSAFEVVISAGAIEDTLTTPNAFAGTTAGQWTFSTAAADPTAPILLGKSPADNAIDVPRGADLVATFDDDILTGSGDIVIVDLLDGSTTRTIAVTDGTQVSVSGKVLTIDPATALAADRDYAVQIAAGAVKNFSEVPFAGIPGSDVTSWNFRTLVTSPNVIFILGDDQAWYDYSFMYRPSVEKAAIDMAPANYPVPAIFQVAQTPAIDRLADEGICFTHGYTPPLCRPSLAAMITGAYPHQTLVTGNDLVNGSGTRIPDEAVEARMQVMNPLPRTLADELGYTCFQTGKWWEGHHTNGGFTAGDTVNSTAGGTAPSQWSAARPSYVTARHGDWGLMTGRVDYVNDVADPAHPIPYANTIQTATDFMDAQVAANQPFLFWYAPFLPHTPHDPPAGLLSKYDALISEPNESGDYFAKYYANIERFDGGVKALLDYLDSKDIADNTIVVMICDNGWINNANASSYYARSKQTAYEAGVRTPIIVRWPDRIKAGGDIEPQFVSTPVSVVDLVPTIHDALGLPTFPEMTGVSLLRPDLVAARDTIFTEDSDHDIANLNDPLQSLQARVAIRDGWKMILPYNTVTQANGAPELYHLYDTSTGNPVDPHEDTNLAGSNPTIVGELTEAIEDWYNDRYGFWISHPSRGIGAADRGFNVDPDGDHLANGLEAWFGTRPGEFDLGLTLVGGDGTTFTFRHPRNENPPSDLSGFYEWSPNLTDWYEGDGVDGPPGGSTVCIVPSPEGNVTTVTATASGAIARLFVRAGVLQN